MFEMWVSHLGIDFTVIFWGIGNFQSYSHEKVLVLATCRPKSFLEASDKITEMIPAETDPFVESEDPFCHQKVSLKRFRSEIWREVSCGREDDVSQSLEFRVYPEELLARSFSQSHGWLFN